MGIGLPKVIKFCTRKTIKKTRFISPCKMINLFQDEVCKCFLTFGPLFSKYKFFEVTTFLA